MADEIPPVPAVASPAINPIDPAVAKSYLDTATAADTLNKSATNASISHNTLTNSMKSANSTMSSTSGALNNLNELSSKLGVSVDVLVRGFLGVKDSMYVFSQSAEQLNTFENQLSSVRTEAGLLGSVFSKMASVIPGGSEAIKTGSSAVGKFITNLAKGADQSFKLQEGFLHMAGSAGGLKGVFDSAGDGLVNLNDEVFKQNQLIIAVAGQAGLRSDQVTGFYKSLGEAIPESFTKQITAANSAGGSYQALVSEMKLAEGAGRSMSDVISSMKVAWDTYGDSGEKALEFTGRMSELSEKFGINLEYTRKFIEDNANAFKMLSDNADDGAIIFNRYYQSLKDTGLSAKQSSELISVMTTQMSHLTVAQKAFLSAQSGGPGGLRGALQIEGLLREGKVSEVLDKAQEALKKQFGGKIYTQKEAQESEFAAGQFIRQRELIKSGAFGGLVKDDASATRLLEAMQAGTDKVKALQDPGALVNQFVERGRQLQDQRKTPLTMYDNLKDQEANIANYQSRALISNISGGNVIGRNPGSEIINRQITDFNQKQTKTLEDLSVGFQNPQQRKPLDIKTISSQNKDAFVDFVKTIAESVKAAISGKPTEPQATKPAGAPTIPEQPKKTLTETTAQAIQAASLTQAEAPPTERVFNRGIGTANAVSTAVQNIQNAQELTGPFGLPITQRPATNQPTTPQAPKQEPVKVDITLKQVMCSSCAKPIPTDAHTLHVTGGTVK